MRTNGYDPSTWWYRVQGRGAIADAADIGIVGLGVMGRNLALNLADHGSRVALYDRWPWLDRLAAQIARWSEADRDVVLTCSALKRAYRWCLIAGRGDVRLVLLSGDAALIGARLEGRRGHFMPPDLLASQFETLEPPGPDEAPIVAAVADPPDAIVLTIDRALGHVGSRRHDAAGLATRDGGS